MNAINERPACMDQIQKNEACIPRATIQNGNNSFKKKATEANQDDDQDQWFGAVTEDSSPFDSENSLDIQEKPIQWDFYDCENVVRQNSDNLDFLDAHSNEDQDYWNDGALSQIFFLDGISTKHMDIPPKFNPMSHEEEIDRFFNEN